jgi:pimeloyl-ACP methyl ester carboxylesterase
MIEQSISNRSLFADFLRKLYKFVEPELRDVLQRKALECEPAVLLNDMLCCDKFDIMDRVQEIKLPTLALCGSEDVMTPPKYTAYLARKIEGAREVIIQGGTHMVFAEQPGAVNRAIEDFLNSL